MTRTEKWMLLTLGAALGFGALNWWLGRSIAPPEPRKITVKAPGEAPAVDPTWRLPEQSLKVEQPVGADRVPVGKDGAWRFPYPYQGQQAAALFAQLEGRCRPGQQCMLTKEDSATVVALSVAMVGCRRLTVLKAALVAAVDYTGKDGPTQEEVQSAREEARGLEATCGGLPPHADAESDRFVQVVAAAGDLHAKWIYASGGVGFGNRGIEEVLKDPTAFARYQDTTREYLDELISAGNISALGRRADIAMGWEQDPVGTWAYEYARVRAEGNVTRQQAMLDRLPRAVPAERQAEARALADAAFARCCRK